MPTYDYRCSSCGHTLEIQQKMSDLPLKKCDSCGQDNLKRGPGGGFGFHLQGAGWYKNDYNAPKATSTSEKSEACCPCGKAAKTCTTKET